MTRRKRIPILAGFAAALCLAMALGALALASAWPFADSSDPSESRHIVWKGEVTLTEGALYALDRLPVVVLGECVRCLSITSKVPGHPILNAGNGILGWPGTHEPTFTDCVLQRNEEGTLDWIALGVAHTSRRGVARHGWLCATGGSDDGLMRMQFNGREGGKYRFRVTSWGRPVEG
jgi:hypothetical protein